MVAGVRCDMGTMALLASNDVLAAEIVGEADPRESTIGSNNWAVAGSRSLAGAALLADDMHLGLTVPAIWFRAQLEIGQGAGAIRAEGVTLPGLPALIVGSNGQVAWGFTNGYGQWFDWIKLPRDLPPGRLLHVSEAIAVKGEPDVALSVAELDGAPVAREEAGQSYALRWAADMGEAYNLGLDAMLGAQDVAGAVAVAQRAGMPHQNILVADGAGHIAWTIAGRLWAGSRLAPYGRFETPGLPAVQWLAPADYPLIVDPPAGQLWTANARQLAGPGGAIIGDGRFDLGARAQQIRDRLSATPRFDEASLGAIQLDDEARFMSTWRDRVMTVLASDATRPAAIGQATTPAGRRADIVRLLQAWNGRADADQAAYTLLRSTRLHVLDALWRAWTTPLLGSLAVDAKQRPDWQAMFEYSATAALAARPLNLLPLPYANWDEFLLAQLDAAADDVTHGGDRTLAQSTWGADNASRIGNLLSRALPLWKPLLDMPSLPQSGDGNMPHVAGPSFGQSERLVVSPGHEAHATLTMAGGQSGHPMSPYYGAGHAAWAMGGATPLLAGAIRHTLTLSP